MTEAKGKRSYSLDDYTHALDKRYGAVEFDYGSGTVHLQRLQMMQGKQRADMKKLVDKLQQLYREIKKAVDDEDESFDTFAADDRLTAAYREILGHAGDAPFRKWLADQPDGGVMYLWSVYNESTELPEASTSSDSSQSTAGRSSLTSDENTGSPS